MPGFQEWLVIAVVALIVVGPNRLPGVARTVGQLIVRFRHEAMSATAALRNETDLGEIGDELRDLRRELQDTKRLATRAMREVAPDDLMEPAKGRTTAPRRRSEAIADPAATDPATATATDSPTTELASGAFPTPVAEDRSAERQTKRPGQRDARPATTERGRRPRATGEARE